MKKIFIVVACFAAISFASCDHFKTAKSSACDSDSVAVDTLDSVAVDSVDTFTVDTTAVDTITVDSMGND